MNTPSLDEEIKGNKPEWVGLRDKALFTLLYATGMRISEGLSLRRSSLPLGDHIVIKGKGSKERLIPILEEVKQAIMTYIDACPILLSPQDTIFIGVKGNPLHPHVAQKVIRDYRRLVGLPETVTPHALRHTCATHLLSNDGDLRTIQELLGHTSLTSTQIYTNVDQMQLMKTFKAAHPRSK
jgi:integrase/recombinase XerC